MGGQPYSFQTEAGLSANVPTERMPYVDVASLEREDAFNDRWDIGPARFAHGIPVDLGFGNSGLWETLPNGDRIWRLNIQSEGAVSLNLLFSSFYMPKAASLFIYDKDKKNVMGAFGAHNNRPHGQFATAILKGGWMSLEYYEPRKAKGQGRLAIKQVSHGYRGFEAVEAARGLGDSAFCQVDVNCSPESTNWQDEKKGVVRTTFNGTSFCTATLLRSTGDGCVPYVLAASHCVVGTYDAITNPTMPGYVIYFNYERATCGGTDTPPNETISGGTMVANAPASDFALIQMDDNPEDYYTVYYNGWDARDITPQAGGVCIHHPAGDAKKIATFTGIPQDFTWAENYPNTHWNVTWAATPNGHSIPQNFSSGSPLFDARSRMLGQLHGADNVDCNYATGTEGYFGKLSYSWNNNGATDNRRKLMPWLDRGNTGATVMDGRSGSACAAPDFVLAVTPQYNSICAPSSTTYNIVLSAMNAYASPVTLSAVGNPGGTSVSFSTNPITPNGSTTMTISGSGSPGTYTLNITGTDGALSHSFDVSYNIATTSIGNCTLSTPSNAATNVSTSPTLAWNAASGAESYHLQIATDAAFANIVAENTGISATFLENASILLANRTYYWQVRGENACTVGNWSSTFSFTTIEDCHAPIVDSGFEQDDLYWGEYSSQNKELISNWSGGTTANTGSYHALLGDVANELSIVYQEVNIPLNVVSASMTYYYKIISNETGCGGDKAGVTVVNFDLGTYKTNLQNYNLCISNVTSGYVQATYDLMAFAGKTINIGFYATTNASLSSSFLVDDVAINFCVQSPCTGENLVINDAPLADGAAYFASKTIVSQAVAAYGKQADFVADSLITLQVGFHAQAGSDFHARIAPCFEPPASLQESPTARLVATSEKTLEKISENFKKLASLEASPNPSNERTLIRFDLPTDDKVLLELYDANGRKLRILASAQLEKGLHEMALPTIDLPNGLYFLRLQSTNGVETKKLIVMHQ